MKTTSYALANWGVRKSRAMKGLDEMKAQTPALLGLEDIVRILRDKVERAGSQAEWARKNRVNGPDLSSTITGKRPPTKDILRALKLKKVFAYQRGGVAPDPKRLARIKSIAK